MQMIDNKMKEITCGQMRAIDKAAIEEYGIPGVVLMENAAISVFEICKGLEAYKQKNVLIFCGTGNNGGDGFAIARHMHNDGVRVMIVITGDPEKIKGDAKINHSICVNMSIDMRIWNEDNLPDIMSGLASCSLILDAMLGTGSSGQLKWPVKEAVSAINASGKFVVAVDSPTGGDPDSGAIADECVKAELTVTLALLKPGLLKEPLAGHAGKIEIGSIGAPKALLDIAETAPK